MSESEGLCVIWRRTFQIYEQFYISLKHSITKQFQNHFLQKSIEQNMTHRFNAFQADNKYSFRIEKKYSRLCECNESFQLNLKTIIIKSISEKTKKWNDIHFAPMNTYYSCIQIYQTFHKKRTVNYGIRIHWWNQSPILS